MPQILQLSRSRAIHDASIASSRVLDFLAPAIISPRLCDKQKHHLSRHERRCFSSSSSDNIETFFYAVLSQVSHCDTHRRPPAVRHVLKNPPPSEDNSDRKEQRQTSRNRRQPRVLYGKNRSPKNLISTITQANHPMRKTLSYEKSISFRIDQHYREGTRSRSNTLCKESKLQEHHEGRRRILSPQGALSSTQSYRTICQPYEGESNMGVCSDFEMARSNKRLPRSSLSTIPLQSKQTQASRCAYGLAPQQRFSGTVKLALSSFHIDPAQAKLNLGFHKIARPDRMYHTHRHQGKSKQERFAEGSHIPPDFFNDVSVINQSLRTHGNQDKEVLDRETSARSDTIARDGHGGPEHTTSLEDTLDLEKDRMEEQVKLLHSVRQLEEMLNKARVNLSKSISTKTAQKEASLNSDTQSSQPTVVLSKEDYMNLVDLYYYSHNSRFSPESTDKSPTPIVLNDYSFTLSSDFTSGSNDQETVNEDESYESPLKRIDEMLKQRQLREIAVMQVFVDLLLDEKSSNRALYEAYKQLPDPGVAYLPKGITRLFLQRMSTPWTLSEKSMLRYLALVDDMQRAQLPITVAEWSSAIYLAGRVFSSVTNQEVNRAFQIWNEMERSAGVRSSHVTFNILFDIAVRSGSFALGETILREMHSRNLRLNRLGRVSLMYYHGLRKDGDGVRKAYRDFVEAGEIVDTLVLNCVIASLLNAQEPQAAEQVYTRMKNIQSQLRTGFNKDGGEVLYKHHPDPGGNTIDLEMASNHLGRILEKAPRLKRILPYHHQELQARIPLTPNYMTFRSMIAYHATTSGDLDRLTVLLQEMTDIFEIPLQTITFQLLFKGFAFHGPVGGPQSVWSVKRLELCWNACRSAIKASQPQKTVQSTTSQGSGGGNNNAPSDSVLPSAAQINAIPPHAPIPNENPPLSRPPLRRLSDWSEFVLDLAAFPRERLKRLERFHSTMFDAEGVVEPHDKPGVHTFQSPFFQSNAYTAPEPQLDREEGEYELPNPSGPGLLHNLEVEGEMGLEVETNEQEPSSGPPNSAATTHQVVATRALVCWLLRAYARNTKSRSKVEEIWNSIRKVYKPKDASERESVVRVLRRCLRDCDREGNG